MLIFSSFAAIAALLFVSGTDAIRRQRYVASPQTGIEHGLATLDLNEHARNTPITLKAQEEAAAQYIENVDDFRKTKNVPYVPLDLKDTQNTEDDNESVDDDDDALMTPVSGILTPDDRHAPFSALMPFHLPARTRKTEPLWSFLLYLENETPILTQAAMYEYSTLDLMQYIVNAIYQPEGRYEPVMLPAWVVPFRVALQTADINAILTSIAFHRQSVRPETHKEMQKLANNLFEGFVEMKEKKKTKQSLLAKRETEPIFRNLDRQTLSCQRKELIASTVLMWRDPHFIFAPFLCDKSAAPPTFLELHVGVSERDARRMLELTRSLSQGKGRYETGAWLLNLDFRLVSFASDWRGPQKVAFLRDLQRLRGEHHRLQHQKMYIAHYSPTCDNLKSFGTPFAIQTVRCDK